MEWFMGGFKVGMTRIIGMPLAANIPHIPEEQGMPKLSKQSQLVMMI